ncbi:unnamed protein product [Allacma fusca]|uniref:Uncharacterized protein n=1 Tax=Allacma fusca TaxID=39272 RepID=A0A8J2P436_9HEXA|nr:unnamed protein product [Allacma fusca]
MENRNRSKVPKTKPNYFYKNNKSIKDRSPNSRDYQSNRNNKGRQDFHHFPKKPNPNFADFFATDSNVYISDFEKRMMNCEKLTLIQRFELATTSKLANKIPRVFVERGIIHMESNPSEINEIGENMPYNPKAVTVTRERESGKLSVTLTSSETESGIRERVRIRPEGKLFHCPAMFDQHVRHIADNVDWTLLDLGIQRGPWNPGNYNFFQSTQASSSTASNVTFTESMHTDDANGKRFKIFLTQMDVMIEGSCLQQRVITKTVLIIVM